MSESDDPYTVPKLRNGLGAVRERPKEWFLLVEDRPVVAGGLLLVLLAFFLAVELTVGVAEENRDPLFYMFGGMTGGNLTLITVVLSINQLIISRQLGTPGDLREEIEGVNEFREQIEEALVEEVAPVTPTEFLDVLLRSVQERLETVEEGLDDVDDPETADEIGEVIDSFTEHIVHTDELLSRSEAGVFEALSVTLNTNYSAEIYRIRQIQAERGDHLSEDVNEILDALVVRIQQIDVTRQYFKTLYLQDEFAYLSRLLLYTGVPAVVASLTMLLLFAAGPNALIPGSVLSVLVPVVLVITIAPLAVLFAFVLRVATVAQRTAAITPFNHHGTGPGPRAGLADAASPRPPSEVFEAVKRDPAVGPTTRWKTGSRRAPARRRRDAGRDVVATAVRRRGLNRKRPW